MGEVARNEIKYWQYRNRNGDPIFQLTSNETRTRYYLYEYDSEGGWRKLGSAKTPIDLEERYNVEDRMFE